MTNDHRNTESEEWAGLEIASRSLGPRASAGANGQGENSSDGGGPAGNGQAGNGSDGGGPAGNGRAGESPEGSGPAVPVAAGRRYVPPDVLESVRGQVADFADFTHRGRAKLPDQLRALGSGGGITAQVVRKIAAEVIRAELAPWLGVDEQSLCDSLMLSLVAPGELVELTRSQRASFVVTRGQLMIDVSTAEVGNQKPVTHLVALPARQAPAEPDADGSGARAAPADGGESPPPAAAVIVGAAAVASRPYLSLDRLMSHARRAVFEHVSSAAHSTGGGLQAARQLEIVVLMEPALGGGLWIDVNPATSLPEAALAIALPAPPERIRFTHVLLPGADEQGMLAAGGATG